MTTNTFAYNGFGARLSKERQRRLDDLPAERDPSIVMPRNLHVEITRRLRSELPYGGEYGMDEVLDAYRRVYSDAPHLVTEVEEFLQPHRLGR